MADLALATQLQQWTFDKPTHTTRSERSGSSSSTLSSNMRHTLPTALRIDTARKESVVLQERYLSSEEHLSSLDAGSESDYDSDFDYDDQQDDDNVVIHEEFKARTMSISRWDKGMSCDLAVAVSYAFVGRPKVVELASDCRFPPHSRPLRQQRSVSFADAPAAAVTKLRQIEKAQRMSMHVTSSRRMSPMHVSDSASNSSRSASLASPRPSTSTIDSRLHLVSTQSPYQHSQPTSSTASSPALSFLSSDPFGNAEDAPPSPMAKPAAHKRLRSISMKLALAKIAITPSKKAADPRTPTPLTPQTPMSPLTTPRQAPSPAQGQNKLRRASILRPKSRSGDSVSAQSVPPVPALPAMAIAQNRTSRMLARGADEREPTLVLPPCPSSPDDHVTVTKTSRKLRRRKSMMDLF